MGKFIVIEVNEYNSSLNTEGFVNGLLKEHNIAFTELSTDESIDIIKIIGWMRDKGYDRKASQSIAPIIKQFATEQSLIEQMKAKEFAEWCSINGWFFYTKDNLWRKHGNGGFEYKTTEQLFNQFTNQKQNG